MKLKIFFAAIILSAIVLISSCTKESTAAVYTLEGSWVGTYGIGTSVPTTYYSFHFKPGGNLLIESSNIANPDLANGSWSLAGDSVKGIYKYIVGGDSIYSFGAKYSSASNIITGTWGRGATDYVGGGTFSITKE